MGMYDSVKVGCPQCGSSVEFQSKAGPCLTYLYEGEVPPEIAADINGMTMKCGDCGYLVTARYAVPPEKHVPVWGE